MLIKIVITKVFFEAVIVQYMNSQTCDADVRETPNGCPFSA